MGDGSGRNQETKAMDKFERKLDQAARAAWMSYVGGIT